MSAAKDYEALRRTRSEHIKAAVKPKTRIAFLSCKDCGYFWSKQVAYSGTVSCICPKCHGDAAEV